MDFYFVASAYTREQRGKQKRRKLLRIVAFWTAFVVLVALIVFCGWY